MAADNTLELLIKLGVIGKADGDAVKQLLDETTKSNTDLAKEMGVVTVTGADVDKALGKTGEAASHAGAKHMALRHIMGELNRISPGLGEAMHLVSESYMAAGEAAEGGAVGVAGFTTAMEEALTALGPLLIAMLSVEAIMKYWDMYKEKVTAAAEAQADAMKKIDESTRGALKAVQELDEAMHPKEHNLAEHDEQNLKQNQEQLENAYGRQKELNQAQEENELQGAGTAEEKEGIKQRFAVLDKQLEDWRDKQNAAIEGAMVDNMNAQLYSLKNVQDKLIEQAKGQYQAGVKSGDMTDYDKTEGLLKKNADEAKAIRDKLDELTGQAASDTNNATFNSETNRQVFGARGIRYVAPGAGFDMPGPDAQRDDAANKFATGQAIADKLASGGKVSDDQARFLVVLEQAITGHAQTLNRAMALIEGQSQNHEFAATLIENAHGRIEQVHRRLEQLEGQNNHAQSYQSSG